MKIIEATNKDFLGLMRFYDSMCTALDEKEFLPNGDKGGFPSDNMVLSAIREHNQFIGIEDDRIVAAYILSHNCDKVYHTVQWQIEATEKEVMILHALRVSPQYGGRGFSKKLMEYAIETAKLRKQKAIRLDVLEGNFIPEKMYASYGFKYIDTVQIFYEDIGETMRFRLMELVL